MTKIIVIGIIITINKLYLIAPIILNFKTHLKALVRPHAGQGILKNFKNKHEKSKKNIAKTEKIPNNIIIKIDKIFFLFTKFISFSICIYTSS